MKASRRWSPDEGWLEKVYDGPPMKALLEMVSQ